ncbi:hypothetical protein Tco_0838075 [Tanacetum coccineum]
MSSSPAPCTLQQNNKYITLSSTPLHMGHLPPWQSLGVLLVEANQGLAFHRLASKVIQGLGLIQESTKRVFQGFSPHRRSTWKKKTKMEDKSKT